MQNQETLSNHKHPFKSDKIRTDCTCFKKIRSKAQLRYFYYHTNSGIVVATITGHRSETEYNNIINGNRQLYSKNHPAHIHFNKLEDSILITPLGKTPMVVTQTFTLLSERESVNINKVIVVHPCNSEIRSGVQMLKTAFRNMDCKVESIEINGITDIASKNDCSLFLEKLVSVIDKEKKDNSDNSIRLSLSGGRKGMAALTLFAAQRANIDVVYHTLIADINLERNIEKETTLSTLNKLTRDHKMRHLFLDAYDKSQFELFRVPIIPISIGLTHSFLKSA